MTIREQITEKQKEIAELEKLEELEYGWLPEYGEKFFLIDTDGSVESSVWSDSEARREIRRFLGVFKTEEEAGSMRDAVLAWRWAKEEDGLKESHNIHWAIARLREGKSISREDRTWSKYPNWVEPRFYGDNNERMNIVTMPRSTFNGEEVPYDETWSLSVDDATATDYLIVNMNSTETNEEVCK